MTEPSSTADLTLDQQIIAASQELARARRARPRDQARIDAAQAEYDRLIELRDASA